MWAFPFGAGPGAVRRRPGRLRARRRVGAGGRAARAAWRSPPRCSSWATTGSPSTGRAASRGRRRSSRRCSRARSRCWRCRRRWRGGAGGSSAGRLACTACVLVVRRRYVLRLLPGARLGRDRAAGGAAGAGRDGAGAGAAARAVGRGAAAGAGARGAGAVAGRARARDAAARVGPAAASCGATCARAASARCGTPGGGALVRARGALLWLAAALISGFTMRRYLEPFDEGLLMQAASRILDGQWPYADFGWPYGPGQPVAVAGLSWLFEPSVAWWRALRVAADATAALAVWALVRRESPATAGRWRPGWRPRVTVAQPTSANPFPVALAFALCAVLAGARGRAGAGRAAGRRGGVLAARHRRGGRGRRGWWRCSCGAGGEPARERAGRARSRELAARGDRARCYAPFAARRASGSLWDELVGHRGRRRRPLAAAVPASPTRARCAAGRRTRSRRTSRTCSASTCRCVGVALRRCSCWSRSRARRRLGPALAGRAVLALGCALYLFSRPDDLHAQPLIVCLCAAVPLARGAGTKPRRRWRPGASRPGSP